MIFVQDNGEVTYERLLSVKKKKEIKKSKILHQPETDRCSGGEPTLSADQRGGGARLGQRLGEGAGAHRREPGCGVRGFQGK